MTTGGDVDKPTAETKSAGQRREPSGELAPTPALRATPPPIQGEGTGEGANAALPDALSTSDPELVTIIREEIGRAGAITFARFMELALYHPEHGYYLTEARRPGRGGDFLTAPEASAYFGLTLARQIAECWERLGRPSPFTIREYGAGVGGLAYDILAGLSEEAPEMRDAVRYRLVEPNRYRLTQALAAMAEVGLDGPGDRRRV